MPSSKAYQKELRNRWKAAGLCSMCGIGKPRKGLLTCKDCESRYREYHRSLKRKILKAYGQKCVCCGITTYEFLCLDHVNNDGKQDRKELGSGMTSGALYRLIIRLGYPKKYQILCHNCNMSLGFFGYCPHQPKIKRSISKNKA
jgi:hypothetical protein